MENQSSYRGLFVTSGKGETVETVRVVDEHNRLSTISLDEYLETSSFPDWKELPTAEEAPYIAPTCDIWFSGGEPGIFLTAHDWVDGKRVPIDLELSKSEAHSLGDLLMKTAEHIQRMEDNRDSAE